MNTLYFFACTIHCRFEIIQSRMKLASFRLAELRHEIFNCFLSSSSSSLIGCVSSLASNSRCSFFNPSYVWVGRAGSGLEDCECFSKFSGIIFIYTYSSISPRAHQYAYALCGDEARLQNLLRKKGEKKNKYKNRNNRQKLGKDISRNPHGIKFIRTADIKIHPQL